LVPALVFAEIILPVNPEFGSVRLNKLPVVNPVAEIDATEPIVRPFDLILKDAVAVLPIKTAVNQRK